jgi:hypothetical protein
VSYHIHVPRGGVVTCLPEDYDTLEDAILAFELDTREASWCLIDRRENDRAPFVMRGTVEGTRLHWAPVKG